MTKVVYSDSYGGFSLSERAIKRYAEIAVSSGETLPEDFAESQGRSLSRTDPILVLVVEVLGRAADGYSAKLCIRDVPEGELYRIEEEDGKERVMLCREYNWQVG